MNKKGMAVGAFVLMAVMVIVAVALLPTIFTSQAQMTNTYKINNYSVTLGAVGVPVYLPYQEMIDTPVFWNKSVAQVLVNNANFTVTEAVDPTTSTKRISITPVADSSYGGAVVNFTGTVGLEGYADDTGARSIAGLIGLMAVLALFAGVVFYFWKEGGLDFLNR